jgi:hypothetical protein
VFVPAETAIHAAGDRSGLACGLLESLRNDDPIHHGEPKRPGRGQEFSMRSPAVSWSKRFVVAGFLFFVCKGLLWLAVLAAVWRLY